MPAGNPEHDGRVKLQGSRGTCGHAWRPDVLYVCPWPLGGGGACGVVPCLTWRQAALAASVRGCCFLRACSKEHPLRPHPTPALVPPLVACLFDPSVQQQVHNRPPKPLPKPPNPPRGRTRVARLAEPPGPGAGRRAVLSRQGCCAQAGDAQGHVSSTFCHSSICFSTGFKITSVYSLLRSMFWGRGREGTRAHGRTQARGGRRQRGGRGERCGGRRGG